MGRSGGGKMQDPNQTTGLNPQKKKGRQEEYSLFVKVYWGRTQVSRPN